MIHECCRSNSHCHDSDLVVVLKQKGVHSSIMIHIFFIYTWMSMARKRKQRRSSTKTSTSLKHAIKQLSQMSAPSRRQALLNSNDQFVRQMCSAVKSLRNKPLSGSLRTRLMKHRSALKSMVNPQLSLSSKRRTMARQKGGFFGTILASLALPILTRIVGAITGH